LGVKTNLYIISWC